MVYQVPGIRIVQALRGLRVGRRIPKTYTNMAERLNDFTSGTGKVVVTPLEGNVYNDRLFERELLEAKAVRVGSLATDKLLTPIQQHVQRVATVCERIGGVRQ